MPRLIGWLGALVSVVGCQAPPARVAACADDRSPPRKLAFVRQFVADSAAETVQSPLGSLWTVASEPVEYVRAAGNGLALKRVGMRFCRPGPVAACRPRLDAAALEADLDRMSRDELRPAFVQVYTDGAGALAALESLIDEARCRLDVLMYIWDNDGTGWEVARRLAERARAGVAVRVLVDGGGNLLQGHPREATAREVNAVECWLSAQPGVALIRTRDPWARFDHRKLVVADGQVAWTGGRNFTDTSFWKAHDLSFTVAGPLAGEMDAVFEAFWQKQAGPPGADLGAPAAELPANARARLVHTGPFERVLAYALYQAVSQARHHVYIENPYLADNRLEFELARARQRGADVRVVLTQSDENGVVNRSNRVTANRLLRAGVRVYIYPTMLHVKATAVDGLWAYLGTGNFDRLSLRHNYEMGLAVAEGPVVHELEETLFLPDFRPEWERIEPFPLAPQDYAAEAVVSLFL